MTLQNVLIDFDVQSKLIGKVRDGLTGAAGRHLLTARIGNGGGAPSRTAITGTERKGWPVLASTTAPDTLPAVV